MKIRVILKDALIARVYDAESFWEGNNTLYILSKTGETHVYPMIHVWRIEIPKFCSQNMPEVMED